MFHYFPHKAKLYLFSCGQGIFILMEKGKVVGFLPPRSDHRPLSSILGIICFFLCLVRNGLAMTIGTMVNIILLISEQDRLNVTGVRINCLM